MTATKWIMPWVLAVVVGAIVIATHRSSLVRSYHSPDGRFAVEVHAYKEIFAMPGDGGSGRGFVTLRRSNGDIIEKKKSDYVGIVDSVIWREKTVDIKSFADWELPGNQSQRPAKTE